MGNVKSTAELREYAVNLIEINEKGVSNSMKKAGRFLLIFRIMLSINYLGGHKDTVKIDNIVLKLVPIFIRILAICELLLGVGYLVKLVSEMLIDKSILNNTKKQINSTLDEEEKKEKIKGL